MRNLTLLRFAFLAALLGLGAHEAQAQRSAYGSRSVTTHPGRVMLDLSRPAQPAQSTASPLARVTEAPALEAVERLREIALYRGGTVSVAVLSPDAQSSEPDPPTNILNDLNAFPDISAEMYTAPLADITAADLAGYDVVVTSNNHRWSAVNADVAVGNALADYVDAGGKVVVMNFAHDNFGWELAGRFITGGYSPFNMSTGDLSGSVTMQIVETGHAIVEGVGTVSNQGLRSNVTVRSGATLIANWGASNPAVAATEDVVAINALYGSLVQWSGDLDVLLHNAVVWLAGEGGGGDPGNGEDFYEGFDDITTLAGDGWVLKNNSSPTGSISWFQGNTNVFPAYDGDDDAYIGANFNSTAGAGTISNWLILPEMALQNGTELSFFARANDDGWADRLQVRLSTAGASTDVGSTATSVGDFEQLLLDINPDYEDGVFINEWTEYTVTVSGLSGTVNGRFALRYFVESGGPSGDESDYIGIDAVSVTGIGDGGGGDDPGVVLLSEDFESGIPSDWAVFGNEHSGGESVWAAYNESTLGNVARSRYIFSVPDGEFSEDYLATPQLDIGPGGATLSFLAADQFTTVYDGFYQVLVSTTSQTDPAAYEVVATYTDPDFPTASTGGATFEVDLSNYAGQSIYVAFLHRANNDDTWYLDDVVVTSFGSAPVAVLSETEVEIDVLVGETASESVTLSNEGEDGSPALTYAISVAEAHPRSIRLVEATSAPAPSLGAMSLARASGARTYTAIEGAPFTSWRAEGVTLSHSASLNIDSESGIGCANWNEEYSRANQYYRVFDLEEFDIYGELTVESVDVGVWIGNAAGGLPTTKVRLHTLEGPLTAANLTLVAEADLAITASDHRALATATFDDAPTFAPGDVMVVEWSIPDGIDAPFLMIAGFNGAGQTGPTYLRATDCGANEPTDLAALGYPEYHWVMQVHGTTAAALLSVDPRSGSVGAGQSQEITLTANAEDADPGSYDFLVTFATNDPENPTLELAVTVNVGTVATEDGAMPIAFALSPNYPNPFAGRTTIEYALPEATSVRLSVFDATGRLVATLVDGEREAGFHSVEWPASGLASGVYFARIEAGSYRSTQKMVLVQ